MSGNKPTQSYVVRVYRCEATERRQVVGIVETLGDRVQCAFTNVDELWGILTQAVGRPEPECSGAFDSESI